MLRYLKREAAICIRFLPEEVARGNRTLESAQRQMATIIALIRLVSSMLQPSLSEEEVTDETSHCLHATGGR
jgi:hypothetical protein